MGFAMTTVIKLARRLKVDVGGSTATEYAMIASVIALALLAALPGLSTSVGGLFSGIASAF